MIKEIEIIDQIEAKIEADKKLIQSILGDIEYLKNLTRHLRNTIKDREANKEE
jgi:FtsZ-binding cell division protein ZapB